MSLRRDERGQSAVIAVLFLTALLGMTAAVVDVGFWFRAQRQAQSQADAAALAGAQLLPDDPAGAISTAIEYAGHNGVTIAPNDVKVTGQDTIAVDVRSPQPGFFSKVFGIDAVTVQAKAAARSYQPYQARFLAPIVVNKLHPKLSGPGCPCFGPDNETTLPLERLVNAPGAFDMLNLDNSSTGAVGSSTLATWIRNGFDKYLPLGGYYSDPGAKFNSSDVGHALDLKTGDVLLFPVYDTLTGTGSNAEYHIIGWVGFHLESFDASGSSGSLTGYFTSTIWDGLDALPGGTTGPDLGVRSVELVQ
jgi:hypothetical protein